MFTGIVAAVGRIEKIEPLAGGQVFGGTLGTEARSPAPDKCKEKSSWYPEYL